MARRVGDAERKAVEDAIAALREAVVRRRHRARIRAADRRALAGADAVRRGDPSRGGSAAARGAGGGGRRRRRRRRCRVRGGATGASTGERRAEGSIAAVELERYTDRAKGFLQSAQTLALRSGHQRLTPEHLLKVLLEDKEGLCANLIAAAGGDPKRALAGVEAELAKLPQGRGRRRRPGLSVARAGAPVRPGGADRREGRRLVRHGRAAAARAGARQGHAGGPGAERGRASRRRALNAAIEAHPQGPHGGHAPRPRKATTR